jgi:hypothetical protein
VIRLKDYVKGVYKQSIFKSDKGYIIGLLKVSETNIPEMTEYVGKTITFTGYFADKCMSLFQCLTSMYLGNKKALNKNNRINSTGICRRRSGANYRRNNSNRRRKVRY